MQDFVSVYYNGEFVERFANVLEAEDFVMEAAAFGAVIEKENGDERDLVEIEQAEMNMYEVIEK